MADACYASELMTLKEKAVAIGCCRRHSCYLFLPWILKFSKEILKIDHVLSSYMIILLTLPTLLLRLGAQEDQKAKDSFTTTTTPTLTTPTTDPYLADSIAKAWCESNMSSSVSSGNTTTGNSEDAHNATSTEWMSNDLENPHEYLVESNKKDHHELKDKVKYLLTWEKLPKVKPKSNEFITF